MSIIYVLIPLAIILVGVAVLVFFWAVKANQFEDLDRQGYSILFDDDLKENKHSTEDLKLNDSEAPKLKNVDALNAAQQTSKTMPDKEC